MARANCTSATFLASDRTGVITNIQQADVAITLCAFYEALVILHPKSAEVSQEAEYADLGQNVLVKDCLHCAHFNPQDAFALGGKRLYNISLEAAKHEGFELLVELLNLCLVIDIG